MLIFSLIYFVFFIPCIFGNSLLEAPIVKFSKKVLNESHYEGYNKTKLNLISEGGPLLPNTAGGIIQLPKDEHSVLLNLDNEIGKNKEKSVVARKGAVYTSSEDIQMSLDSTKLPTPNIPIVDKESNLSKEKDDSKLKENTVSVNHETMKNHRYSEEINDEKHKNVVPKKPLVLSNEALDKITMKDSEVVYPKEVQITKVTRNPNSHPGMVMPIVITILVVPMFAVIGYLAIKRGREAWKNRHYKRMDFLLDGMYND